MTKIIEIASYPKCGNTWMRQLLAKTFGLNVDTGIPDIHQQKERTRDLMENVSLSEDVYFYKSHVLNNQKINPDKIIYMYRHPLDVFLSSLNYFFIRQNVNHFKNKEPKSVEQIFTDGEMDVYFEKFCEELGMNYYKGLLGEFSDFSNYVELALDCPKVLMVRYEDLVDHPVKAYETLLCELFPNDDIAFTDELFTKVDDVTKRSKKPFYWKATKEAHKEFLTHEQISKFNKKHQLLLNKLGY